MSNYTSENLIQVAPQNVPAGTLLIKIGDDVFTAGIELSGSFVLLPLSCLQETNSLIDRS